jgi:hypothetical protein
VSTQREKTPVKLLPFQQENVSTNQQRIALPYMRGERLVAVRWITDALDHQTQTVPKSSGKGKG